MGEAATAVASGVGAAAEIWQGEREREALKDNRREQREALDDLAYRREATYRGNRMALQGAIEDFYKQKGWAIPERLPGAYTVRGLPGEAALYPGVSRENPKFESTADDADESEADQIASKIDTSKEPTDDQVEYENPKQAMTVADEIATKIPVTLETQPLVTSAEPSRAVPAPRIVNNSPIELYIPDRKYAATQQILPRLARRNG